MILKRGDHIHLAIPLGMNEDMRDKAKSQLMSLYNQMGVYIPILSEHEGLKEPRIVAVFREEA